MVALCVVGVVGGVLEPELDGSDACVFEYSHTAAVLSACSDIGERGGVFFFFFGKTSCSMRDERMRLQSSSVTWVQDFGLQKDGKERARMDGNGDA